MVELGIGVRGLVTVPRLLSVWIEDLEPGLPKGLLRGPCDLVSRLCVDL